MLSLPALHRNSSCPQLQQLHDDGLVAAVFEGAIHDVIVNIIHWMRSSRHLPGL